MSENIKTYKILVVEIVCQGEEEELKQFINEVRKGPAFSVVSDIEIEEIKKHKKYNSFDIKF
jgi:acylphosphatase